MKRQWGSRRDTNSTYEIITATIARRQARLYYNSSFESPCQLHVASIENLKLLQKKANNLTGDTRKIFVSRLSTSCKPIK